MLKSLQFTSSYRRLESGATIPGLVGGAVADGFPDLFVTGVHGSDLAPSRHGRSRGYGDGADAPADGRAHFDRLLAVLRGDRRAVDLQLGNQAALMDGGSHFVGVGHAASAG